MPVVEYTLQAETAANCAMDSAGGTSTRFALRKYRLHVEQIRDSDVVAITRRIWSRVFRMKEGEHHGAGLQNRPQASHYRLHQALFQIVGHIPAQHDIEMGCRVDKVFLEELAAIQRGLSLLVFGYQGW